MRSPRPQAADARDAVSRELGAEGSLVVEDHHFAIVAEWVITAQVSDAAFRVYSMLLRFGNTSGRRMPSRALLAARLHRSVDSIDRALRELSAAGIVRVEHRRTGRVNLSNRYHLRTTPPETNGGSRTTAAQPRGFYPKTTTTTHPGHRQRHPGRAGHGGGDDRPRAPRRMWHQRH